jgi:hypothetical protein
MLLPFSSPTSWRNHTFGLWWQPDEYVCYVDGKEMGRTDIGGVSDLARKE